MAEIDDLPIDEDLEDVAASPSGKSSRMAGVIVALVGLAGGGAVGMTTLAPSVGPIMAERASSESAGGSHGGDHGGGESEGPSALHLIDNLVVNPASSGGTRFLLTSIAVEVHDPSQTEIVSDRDVELRASLIMVLGAKSVEQLTDISARPGIVAEIERALTQIVGPGVIRKIFIPQFVIQ